MFSLERKFLRLPDEREKPRLVFLEPRLSWRKSPGLDRSIDFPSSLESLTATMSSLYISGTRACTQWSLFFCLCFTLQVTHLDPSPRVRGQSGLQRFHVCLFVRKGGREMTTTTPEKAAPTKPNPNQAIPLPFCFTPFLRTGLTFYGSSSGQGPAAVGNLTVAPAFMLRHCAQSVKSEQHPC